MQKTKFDIFFYEEINPKKLNFDLLLPRDRKILISFRAQLMENVFFTEKQANLLVKILKENKNRLKDYVPGIEDSLQDIEWSSPFRIVKKFRDVFLNNEDFSNITVKFNFDKGLRDIVCSLAPRVKGNFSAKSSTEFKFSLNEHNLILLFNELKQFNFNFDEKIEKMHEEMEKIRISSRDMFDIFSIENKKILDSVKNDIGDITKHNLLLLHDRKFRYQYKISENIKKNSLSEKIAQRESVRVFINEDIFSLTETIRSLIELKRLPVLVVFEPHSSLNCKKHIDLLNYALSNNNIKDQVGVYFRFDKSDDNHGFNKTINELKYNSYLTEETKFVGVANNKLPKFIIKSPWEPMSVISFTNNFKGTKTAVYASRADLVIYYNKAKPLNGNVYDIV